MLRAQPLLQLFLPSGADHYNMLRSYSGRGLGEEAGTERTRSALLADVGGSGGVGGGPVGGAAGGAPPPADEWCYRDPQGVVQGPFARQDIIDW